MFYQNGLIEGNSLQANENLKGTFATDITNIFVSYDIVNGISMPGTRTRASIEYHEKYFTETEAFKHFQKSKFVFADTCF